ncbi:MAG: hypothetical protein Q9176_000505 [Flavoplaca citrina]
MVVIKYEPLSGIHENKDNWSIACSNGQLIAHLQAGIEYDTFRDAIFEALSPAQQANQSDLSPTSADSASRDSHLHSSAPSQQQTAISTAVPSTTPQQDSTNSTPGSSSLQQVMADRRKRLEADKAAKDAAEKERRKGIAQVQREAASAGTSKQRDPASNQSLYAQQQRKRKLEAKAERERILGEIENDKAARKEKEAQRRTLAKADTADAEKETEPSSASEPPQNWAGSGQKCSLQIRLFNGLTIRQKFDPQETLRQHVRGWIAEQRTDGDSPYTLKQIVAPSPSRTITVSEEEQSLKSLNLLPSATLVMVPTQAYTNAYTGDQGIVGKAVSMGYNAASAGVGLVVGALGTVLGFGRATAEPGQASAPGSSKIDSGPVQGSEGSRFRTLTDREDTDHQLYNGNQVQVA